MKTHIWVLVLVLFLLPAPFAFADDVQQAIAVWNNAIGRLKFEDAVRQYGPPSRGSEIADLMIAVWETPPGPAVMMPFPLPGFFGPTYFGTQVPGSHLELTFDRKTRLLKYWRAW